MKPHVVRQGEYVRRIAAERGLDPAAVWERAENRELRERRESPDVLAPGDVVFLPDPPQARHALALRRNNRFQAPRPRIPVRVRVRDRGRPLPNELCLVEGLGPDEVDVRTDAEGVLAFDVPLHVERVFVTLPARDRRFTVRVGHLDPIDTPSGLAARLQNLGLLAPGWRHLREEERDARVRAVLISFQGARALPTTGVLDGATRAALRDAHGP